MRHYETRSSIVRSLLAALGLAMVLGPVGHARAEKLRELVDVAGVRDNQLLGYGIVTGLSGTGDDTTTLVAAQSVLSLLRRMGVQVDPTQIMLKNVAAVVVTANLGAFARSGTRLDVTVLSIGNAKSLAGGVLVQTLLKGADQKTYAVAQGDVITTSAKASGGGGAQGGLANAGRVPYGAIIEREVPGAWVDGDSLKLSLRTPSFTVAARAAEVIEKGLGEGTAKAEDGGSVVVKVPAKFKGKIVELMAALEDLEVSVVRRARVVVQRAHPNHRCRWRRAAGAGGGHARGLDGRCQGTAACSGAGPGASPSPATGRRTRWGLRPLRPRLQRYRRGQRSRWRERKTRSVRLLPRAATLADVSGRSTRLACLRVSCASVLEAMHTAGALEAEVVVE